MVINQILGGSTIAFTLEGHGREEINSSVEVSSTIGWFTSMFPVVLKIEGNEYEFKAWHSFLEPTNLGYTLKSVKEQLRSIPNKGIGFGVLKYLGKKSELQKVHKANLISFNYLGEFDSTLEGKVEINFYSII